MTIFFDLRLPRVLLGVLCGAALSLSGGVMQGVFRNPLADPYVLGTVSGATFGAAIVILIHKENSLVALPLGAFLGALLSTAVILAASELRLQLYFDQGALILVGVALGSLLSALTGIVLLASRTDQIQSLVYWLFGSWNGAVADVGTAGSAVYSDGGAAAVAGARARCAVSR